MIRQLAENYSRQPQKVEVEVEVKVKALLPFETNVIYSNLLDLGSLLV